MVVSSGRLTLTKAEAAQALGLSVDSLERYVLGELRVVHVGRRVLVPASELERYIERHMVAVFPASLTGDR